MDGKGLIREVWADNLEIEMERIRKLIVRYPYVSMVRHFTIEKLFLLNDFIGH